jgi:hypothetical protein
MQRYHLFSGQIQKVNMKKVFLLAAVLFSVAACERAKPVVNNNLIGKWKLSESLADPGDGSGTWRVADPLHPSYLEFKNDGTLSFSPYNIYNSDRYQIISDSTMIFFRGSESFNMRYKFSKTLLSLYAPCIEACGSRYIPVQQ